MYNKIKQTYERKGGLMSHVDIAVTIAPAQQLTDSMLSDLHQYQAAYDIIELRIDQWESNPIALLERVIEQLTSLQLEKRLLVTYRTKAQGGAGQLEGQDYLELLQQLSTFEAVDMIDVEFDKAADKNALIDVVQQLGETQEVIVSYHDFNGTPTLDELKHLYYQMHKLSPDYLKVAVMPKDAQDVLNLLSAMELSQRTLPQHIVGIAMSQLGLVTRTAQGVFGGSISYGCLDEPKAPGQIHVEKLKQYLTMYR
ncbi:3-dehydroquinate dehydratase I [Staphylococcus auricularis]